MNREIKFRGKNKDIGWVEGQVAYDLNEDTYIIREVEQDSSYGLEETMLFATMWYRVDKETIGQYIGLHDENEKEIYEGDIVGDNKIKWIIKWNKNRMGFSLYPTTEQLYDEMPINVENKLGFKILGNIYDNPELLGGE